MTLSSYDLSTLSINWFKNLIRYMCDRIRRYTLRFLSSALGFGVAQLYYEYFLKDLTILGHYRRYYLGLMISLTLAVGNLLSVQVRCITLLFLPMYCGKAGRGVLKVVVLTYVIAGPITNMGLNAKEVVRVFACSRQLSYNLSKTKNSLIYRPLQKALLSMTPEIWNIKNSLRSISNVTAPIVQEIEDDTYLDLMQEENERIQLLLNSVSVSNNTQGFHINRFKFNDTKKYDRRYQSKMECRCEHQLSHGVNICLNNFVKVYDECTKNTNVQVGEAVMPAKICNIKTLVGANICDFKKQRSLVRYYEHLKSAEAEILGNLKNIQIHGYKEYKQDLYNLQDAKEVGDRVSHAFDEKTLIMQAVNAALKVFLALMFLRIVVASQTYHDRYLTDIDYDNLYVTRYFKRIDGKRRKHGKIHLLPLKKMERTRYIHVDSLTYIPMERSKFLTQILKVLLEAVTATTFVMLDRLFYEALDVVRQHALNSGHPSIQDMNIEIQGVGAVSNMLRKILKEINSSGVKASFTNDICLPKPRAMPFVYYVRIYAGYFWILLLLYINPYTLRLRRLICSYFYPKREKQRILHLYNDILKKRMRLQKTMRRKAVQAVRTHYLSGESLLSLRMRFPGLLSWLSVLPVARMKCLICEETEPLHHKYETIACSPVKENIKRKPACLMRLKVFEDSNTNWQRCSNKKCPFVYCEECWRECGRCLACDPALADLTADSLSDDPPY